MIRLLVFLLAFLMLPVAPVFAQQPPANDDGGYAVKKNKAKPATPPQETEPRPTPSVPQPTVRQAPLAPPAQPGVVVTPAPAGAVPSVAAPAPAAGGGGVAERVLRQKFGSEGFQAIMNQAGAMGTATPGVGAPNSDHNWDQSLRRVGGDSVVAPSGTTPVFQGAPQGVAAPSRAGAQPAATSTPAAPPGMQLQQSPPIRIQRVEPPPVINGGYKPATTQDIKGVKENYGGIPGGVVLEGAAVNLGRVDRAAYDPRFNAVALDDRAVYFAKVPPKTLAVMCRAIAEDERVGVSLGRKHIVYGKVPLDSDLAVDLKLADHFLGDIVFAEGDWTSGYRFANGFRPQPNQDATGHVAVFFNFNGFQFSVEQEEVRLTAASFDVRLVPLTEKSDDNGAHQPDLDAVAQGRVSRQYEANARHIADNIGYYQNERIIRRTFAYGEAAAFVRGLKQAGVDLRALATSIESAVAGR